MKELERETGALTAAGRGVLTEGTGEEGRVAEVPVDPVDELLPVTIGAALAVLRRSFSSSRF